MDFRAETYTILSQSSSFVDGTNNMVATIWLLGCCCISLLIIPTSIVFFFSFFSKFIQISSNAKYLPDIFSRIWFRTILLTPKGVGAISIAILTIMIGAINVELSVISTIGFFILIIFILLYIISQSLNIFLFIRKQFLGKELIENRLNLHTVNSGEAIRTQINLKIPFPIGFLVKMRMIVPKKLGGEIRSSDVKKSEDMVNFNTVFKKSRRGKHEVGPIVVEYQDLFGLTSIQIFNFKKNKITIYPLIKNLKKLDWQTISDKYGDDNTVKRFINSDDFFEMREYQRGDDIRKIHWKATAKTDKLMVRNPEITYVTTGNFVVLVDNFIIGEKDAGFIYRDLKGADDILDRIVEVAGSIIDFTLKNNKEIKVFYSISSKKVKKKIFHKTRREEWLDELSQIDWTAKSSTNKNLIYDVIINEAKNASGIFIVTSEMDMTRYGYLASLKKRLGIELNIIFIEPTEFLAEESIKSSRIKRFAEKGLLTVPFLSQYSFFDNMLFKKYDSEDIKIKNYEKLKSRSKIIKNALSLNFKKVKIIGKNSNYVSILENN